MVRFNDEGPEIKKIAEGTALYLYLTENVGVTDDLMKKMRCAFKGNDHSDGSKLYDVTCSDGDVIEVRVPKRFVDAANSENEGCPASIEGLRWEAVNPGSLIEAGIEKSAFSGLDYDHILDVLYARDEDTYYFRIPSKFPYKTWQIQAFRFQRYMQQAVNPDQSVNVAAIGHEVTEAGVKVSGDVGDVAAALEAERKALSVLAPIWENDRVANGPLRSHTYTIDVTDESNEIIQTLQVTRGQLLDICEASPAPFGEQNYRLDDPLDEIIQRKTSEIEASGHAQWPIKLEIEPEDVGRLKAERDKARRTVSDAMKILEGMARLIQKLEINNGRLQDRAADALGFVESNTSPLDAPADRDVGEIYLDQALKTGISVGGDFDGFLRCSVSVEIDQLRSSAWIEPDQELVLASELETAIKRRDEAHRSYLEMVEKADGYRHQLEAVTANRDAWKKLAKFCGGSPGPDVSAQGSDCHEADYSKPAAEPEQVVDNWLRIGDVLEGRPGVAHIKDE